MELWLRASLCSGGPAGCHVLHADPRRLLVQFESTLGPLAGYVLHGPSVNEGASDHGVSPEDVALWWQHTTDIVLRQRLTVPLFCMADGSPAAYGRICFRNHAGMKEDRHIKPSK